MSGLPATDGLCLEADRCEQAPAECATCATKVIQDALRRLDEAAARAEVDPTPGRIETMHAATRAYHHALLRCGALGAP